MNGQRWRRWLYRVLALLWGTLAWGMLPGGARADNCSSLSDCYGTVASGLAATVGIALILATVVSLPSILSALESLAARSLGLDPTEAAKSAAADVPQHRPAQRHYPPGQRPHLVQAALISRAVAARPLARQPSAAARARDWLAGEGVSRLTRHTRDALRRLAVQYAALSRRAASAHCVWRPLETGHDLARGVPPAPPPAALPAAPGQESFVLPILPGWLPPANRRGKRTCHAPCHRPPPASPPSRSISPGCRAACHRRRPIRILAMPRSHQRRSTHHHTARAVSRAAISRAVCSQANRWRTLAATISPPPTSRATRQRRSHRWHAARSQAARRPRRDNHRPISARASIFQPPARRRARLPRKLTSARAITRPRRATSRSVAGRPRHPRRGKSCSQRQCPGSRPQPRARPGAPRQPVAGPSAHAIGPQHGHGRGSRAAGTRPGPALTTRRTWPPLRKVSVARSPAARTAVLPPAKHCAAWDLMRARRWTSAARSWCRRPTLPGACVS